MIDANHGVVSSTGGSNYYVRVWFSMFCYCWNAHVLFRCWAPSTVSCWSRAPALLFTGIAIASSILCLQKPTPLSKWCRLVVCFCSTKCFPPTMMRTGRWETGYYLRGHRWEWHAKARNSWSGKNEVDILTYHWNLLVVQVELPLTHFELYRQVCVVRVTDIAICMQFVQNLTHMMIDWNWTS